MFILFHGEFILKVFTEWIIKGYMVILLPTILYLVYDWTRLASSIKAIIYDQIDSSFISCFYGAILENNVNYDLRSDFFLYV